MFYVEGFNQRVEVLRDGMLNSLRGKIREVTERKVIEQLANVYIAMAKKYGSAVATGDQFSAQPGVFEQPEGERIYFALLDLIQRMELDFSQKFALAVTHDRDEAVEVGKIQLSFLDGIRRHLNLCKALV